MEKFPILNERLFLRSPSANVCFMVTIEKAFDKSIIESALETVAIRHPFLNSLVETDDENNARLVQKNDPIVIDYYKSGEMDWQAWYKKTDNTVFAFPQGPLVKFCVIVDKNTEIIILGHHVIGDSIGYLNLVKDILLALDGKLDTTPQIPPFEPTDKYFKETALLDPGVQSFASDLNEEWRDGRARFSEEDYLTFFEQYRNEFMPDLYVTSIGGKNLKALLKKSKSNDLTINEAIISAFSQAVMENLKQNELRLGVTANVRNELVSEPNNCMGNFVAGISAKVCYDPAKDFISNAKAIAGIIGERLSNLKSRHLAVHFLNVFDKDLLESVMFTAYGGFEHPVSERLAELIGERSDNKGLGILDLGQHDFKNYDNIKIVDLQFIGPALPANFLTVCIIIVNNKLNLCFRYNEKEINANALNTICKRAIELTK